MPGFFDSVARRIGKLDAESLRRQYEHLAEDRRFFEALLRSMHEGVMVVGGRGELKWANSAAERIAGFSYERARGRPAAQILPGGFAPAAQEHLEEGWTRAAVREVEISYPERKIVSVETAPLESRGETLLLLRDVTAEREREADALESGRTDAVRELASGVAHEIGNPLNALTIHLQLLARELRKNAGDERCVRWLKDVETARSEIGRVDSIIRGFLAAIRPVKPLLSPGSLAVPLQRALAALKAHLENSGVRVALDLPESVPNAMIDPGMIEQVFFNLAKNAAEAMKSGSVLEITLRYDDMNVEAVFRDHGSGMAPEELARIFEPYRTTKRDGNGLGLMVSRRIVRAHGGELEAESKQGDGTRFTVRIPRLERRVRRLSTSEDS